MDKKAIFHDGEIAIHDRLNIRESMQEKAESMISFEMSFALRIFYHLQPMVFIGSIDKDGYPWSSIIIGEPGFLKAIDSKTLCIHADPINGDPIVDNIKHGSFVGTLAIELEKRKRRGRVNGVIVTSDSSNGITIAVTQAYSNCPKYIQTRVYTKNTLKLPNRENKRPVISNSLNNDQIVTIEKSDTFFLSSYYIEDRLNSSHGVDISHRGGNPGFIKVNNTNELIFPDYKGNNAFNSMGNILKNPVAGLLFINFETGTTLQITGKTETITDSSHMSAFNGAVSLVKITIAKVIEIENAVDFRWKLTGLAKSNP